MNIFVKYLSQTVYIAAVASCLSLVNACSDVDSEDVNSSDFYAIIPFVSTGNGQTNVRVCLTTGSNFSADEIRLSAGDTLTATANGITKVLARNSCYENTFDVDDGGIEFVVSLDRFDGVGMPNSTVTLPEKFSILMPSENQIFNSGESITVTWSPSISLNKVTLIYRGECVSTLNGEGLYFGRAYTENDTGIHTVLVDDILDVFAYHSLFDRKYACSASVSIARVNGGAIDPNYGKGGVITAVQTRKVGVSINP